MNLDRDLRDALEPFGSDPVADARRVLAALPDGAPVGGGPAPKGLPLLAWWLLAGALTIGLAAGYLLGRATETPVPASPGHPKENPAENPTENPKDKPKDPREDMQGSLMLMAFGEVTVNEPKQSREVLAPNQYYVAIGTIFETAESMAGIYIFANDARVRLAQETVATVDVDRVALRGGRVWISNITRPAPLRIEAELATIQADAAVMQVERYGNGVTVIVLDGSATVRASGGGTRRVDAGKQLQIDAQGTAAAVVDAPFFGMVTSWMTHMVLQQQDETELRARIDQMTNAFIEGTHRDAAAKELRRLGPKIVPRLYKALDQVGVDRELRHRTADLIARQSDYLHHEWLLAMLERGDEETRAVAFHAIVRVSETEVGDEAFWRAASSTDRAVELQRWRVLLR